VVISERHANLAALLAQPTEMTVLSCRMNPAEVENCLLEFGDKPIAVPVAHHPQAISVRNSDSTGYKTGTVKPLRVNTTVNDEPVATVARSRMNALH